MARIPWVVVALLAVACGPPSKIAAGKQGAAEALFAVQTATGDATLVDLYQGPTPSFPKPCRFGGERVQTFENGTPVDGFGVSVFAGDHFSERYADCRGADSSAGIAKLAGTLEGKHTSAPGPADVRDHTYKGRIVFTEALDDFLEVDAVVRLAESQLTVSTGAATVHIVGTLTTSAGTEQLDDTVTVTAGRLSVAAR